MSDDDQFITYTFKLNKKKIPSLPEIIKIIQLILGIVTASLINISDSFYADAYFLGISIAFIFGTFSLLLIKLIPYKTDKLPQLAFYELFYHWIATFILFIMSIIFITEMGKKPYSYYNNWSHPYDYPNNVASAVIGIVNSLLYLASTYLSYICL